MKIICVGFSRILSLMLILFCLALFQGCSQSQPQKLAFTTEYQAVFLDTNQIFFGKIENAGSDYPLLRDAFYVQAQTNPETKETRSVLIKRGSEWHGPDMMYLNAEHIVAIEPVSPNSRVAQLIKDAKAQKGENPQK